TFRTYELERVMADIASAKKQGTKYLAISDDNICLDLNRLEELCDAIIRAGHNDIAYVVQASSVGMSSSEALIEKMARAGFELVFLGIENVSERNLRLMKKGNIVERTKRAIELLHKYNILIVGGMIIGHPEDQEEDIAQNYEFFDRMDVDFYSDQIITPYPKTGMREELLKQGLITNLYDYRKYNGFWANVRTKYLDSQELQFLKWKYRRKYSTFYKTTKTFKYRFPLIQLLRVLALRPYYRGKDFLSQLAKTEREIFQAEMDAFNSLNGFPELPKVGAYNNTPLPAENTEELHLKKTMVN
ncbi:MAG TPA: B12-binding domain-containing radical SAM protein, partial [Candidatus Hypogeohydataceae bacterium YC40]